MLSNFKKRDDNDDRKQLFWWWFDDGGLSWGENMRENKTTLRRLGPHPPMSTCPDSHGAFAQSPHRPTFFGKRIHVGFLHRKRYLCFSKLWQMKQRDLVSSSGRGNQSSGLFFAFFSEAISRFERARLGGIFVRFARVFVSYLIPLSFTSIKNQQLFVLFTIPIPTTGCLIISQVLH